MMMDYHKISKLERNSILQHISNLERILKERRILLSRKFSFCSVNCTLYYVR